MSKFAENTMSDYKDEYGDDSRPAYSSVRPAGYDDKDVFGHEENHQVCD